MVDDILAAFLALSSLNWAGQVINTHAIPNFGVADASWTAPTFKPNPEGPPQPGDKGGGADAIWVGLGGMNGLKYSGNLCQAGELAVEGANGQVTQYLIAEDYPNPSVTSSFTINPGDHITALVGYIGSIPTATVWDSTTGESLSIPCFPPTGGGWDSAEWVLEAPLFTLPDGAHEYQPVLEPNPAQDGVFMWQLLSLGISPGHGWPSGLLAQPPSGWLPNWQSMIQPMNMVWPLFGGSVTQVVASGIVPGPNNLGPDTATITWTPTPYSYPPQQLPLRSTVGG